MLTQQQVALELIGKHIAAYQARDTAHQYASRLQGAQDLLVAQRVQRLDDGTFLVQGRRRAPYHVSLTCECTDFVRKQAPHNWCKHRIAAKIYLKTLVDLEDLRAQEVPHLHYTCDHAPSQELCWQKDCQESRAQLCDACLARLEEAHDPETPPTRTPPEVLAALAAPPYEERDLCAPGHSHPPTTSHAVVSPVTEAPASLNLQMTLPGGGKLMYTMRSAQAGAAGDAELQQRLGPVLAYLEGLGQESASPQGSWWKRLMQSCQLSRTGQETF